MKVLWLCNIVLPQIASELGYTVGVFGGWMTGLAKEIEKADSIELAVCAPFTCNKKYDKIWNSVTFYGFHNSKACTEYNSLLEYEFIEIIKDFKPDIVHIFGTEYPHSLAMVSAFSKPERTIINIQGLVSICAKHYSSGLPYNLQRHYTFRDFVRQDNILQQIKKFKKRGVMEKRAIRGVKHVIGRTDWDRACIQLMNPKVNYYKCEEALRDSFYHEKWDFNNCKKNSIFVSQASYPIKGFHLMLEAFAIIISKYPNAYLYVAGAKITEYVTFKQKIRETSYTKYIKNRMKQLGVLNRVIFLGELDEKKMCQQYLDSHVFVSPSSIENSSNSICEAMQLGIPVVASNVGGISSLLEHAKEGYLYQWDAPYMLAFYVMKIFENELITKEFSDASRRKAEKRHSKERIKLTMEKIYEKMM